MKKKSAKPKWANRGWYVWRGWTKAHLFQSEWSLCSRMVPFNENAKPVLVPTTEQCCYYCLVAMRRGAFAW